MARLIALVVTVGSRPVYRQRLEGHTLGACGSQNGIRGVGSLRRMRTSCAMFRCILMRLDALKITGCIRRHFWLATTSQFAASQSSFT